MHEMGERIVSSYTIVADNGAVCIMNNCETPFAALESFIDAISGSIIRPVKLPPNVKVTDITHGVAMGWRFEYVTGFGFKVSDCTPKGVR